jgi:DNA-binding GntR family transcriptional regulator
MIVSLELRPGSVVSERELMERLAIGRTPVHEALHRLSREKFIEVYPRRGMFVTPVDAGDLAGVTEVRLVLEGHAARLAAERATPVEREQAAALIAEVDACYPDAAHSALIDLDQRIHRHIYECTHNPFLAATLNEYYVLTLRIWFIALDRVARLDEAVREHRELLEAIRAVARGDAYLTPAAVRLILAMQQRELAPHASSLSPREREVLRHTARGFSNQEIAERLFVSPKTVDTYRSRIMAKLDVHRRSELVDYAMRHGLME